MYLHTGVNVNDAREAQEELATRNRVVSRVRIPKAITIDLVGGGQGGGIVEGARRADTPLCGDECTTVSPHRRRRLNLG